uniref:Uncharacterized protein n=1 Tax=Rhizophora mucronata TaxID=61149 RepID=A0A2P2IZG3_RHIMU
MCSKHFLFNPYMANSSLPFKDVNAKSPDVVINDVVTIEKGKSLSGRGIAIKICLFLPMFVISFSLMETIC